MKNIKTINTEYLKLSIQDGRNNAGRIIVKKGQKVHKGQILTLPEANSLNVPIHSPCDGIIEDIFLDQHLHSKNTEVKNIAIKISKINSKKNKGLTNILDRYSLDKYSCEQLITKIRYSGVIGLGGAGFPSFKKILNQDIDNLIINAAECEEPISADAALMENIDNIDRILQGIILLKKILTFGNNKKSLNIVIAIEDNKPTAINNFKKKISELGLNQEITLKVIPTAYPNGDAKYLGKLIFNKEIPKNKHSTSYGILCFNVATVYSIYEAIYDKQPLTTRIVSITGSALQDEGNYKIMIGTPIVEILKSLNLFENYKHEELEIIMGGYFMGVPVLNLNAGILKTTNCLIINKKVKPLILAEECINCGFCVSACPQNLLPQQLFKYSKNLDSSNLQKNNAHHCIECGICDTVCPSNINITDYIRSGKEFVNSHNKQLDNANTLKLRYENFQYRKKKIEQEKLDKRSKQSKINKSELLQRTLAKAKEKNKI